MVSMVAVHRFLYIHHPPISPLKKKRRKEKGKKRKGNIMCVKNIGYRAATVSMVPLVHEFFSYEFSTCKNRRNEK